MNVFERCYDKYGFNFYVINDLEQQKYHIDYFDNLSEALKGFKELNSTNGSIPALGVQKGNCGLDLIHCRNGNNILVTDYRNDVVLSSEMQEINEQLVKLAEFFVENGVVDSLYNKSILPVDIARSVQVIVPIEHGTPDSYFNDKVLKACDGVAFTAINELFIQGEGFIDYKDILEDVSKYAKDNVLKVEKINISYVKKENLIGIDGQADISPYCFERMANEIAKNYCISVYDKLVNRFGGNNFIVMSFDDLPSAVKAWYEVNDKLEYTPGVVDKKHSCCVFNGCDDHFKDIPYEKAAEIYGFDKISDVDKLISEATEVSKNSSTNLTINKNEKNLDRE